MKNDKMKLQYRVNEKIHVREVRVVSDEGSEVMPTRKALDLARQQGVDLVEISPNAQPPVCRLIDYSKFLYQQKRRQKELKQKQVRQEVKEIRFGPQTQEGERTEEEPAEARPRECRGPGQGGCRDRAGAARQGRGREQRALRQRQEWR